jgi:hypothetical protein
MHGADPAFLRDLVNDIVASKEFTDETRRLTLGLLFTVAAAPFGHRTARRIFNVYAIMQHR